jgi:hypothetical protein
LTNIESGELQYPVFLRLIPYGMKQNSRLFLLFILSTLCSTEMMAKKVKDPYWQQRAKYKIDARLNTDNHLISGKEEIVYYNNSPETIDRVYFHLYFNAFRPGSSMDVRSRVIADPDGRVGSRILNLKTDEQGAMHVISFKQNGKSAISMMESETILEIILPQPIKPGGKSTFELAFEGQVPIQVRRSGRDNKEGIDYSMSQWYPKLCEYDSWGWHTDTYIGREFYGVWSDFEVNITISSEYVLGATGVLQNGDEIGFGYENTPGKVKSNSSNGKPKPFQTWRWKAENVHDFMWAADPDYRHDKMQVPGGPMMHFLYQDTPEYGQTWRDAQALMVKGFEFLSQKFGQYPYPQFSVIQGGDGGMEYPMATLVTGNRKAPSLVGVVMHEGAHAWYHGVLGFNESKYFWMDEGFTSFASGEAMDHLFPLNKDDHRDAYNGYLRIVKDSMEESLDTHADHFITNYAYGTAAYSKGEVYLAQLVHLIGREVFDKAMLRFFNEWKFKHPDDRALIRIMEQESGLELDWYNEYFVHSTKTIDYAIDTAYEDGDGTKIVLNRLGYMPTPVDVWVIKKDGTSSKYYIPLDLTRGNKQLADEKLAPVWPWVYPAFGLTIEEKFSDIKSIEIDPTMGIADVNRKNNIFPPAIEE